VVGAGVFGIDVQLDGMVFAAVAACPYFGGSPRVVATKALAEQPGVRQVLVLDEPALLAAGSQRAVAVIAGNWWDAKRALDSIPIEWDVPFRLEDETISAQLLAGLEGAPYRVLRRDGDPAEALQQAAGTFEADYVFPYLEHGGLRRKLRKRRCALRPPSPACLSRPAGCTPRRWAEDSAAVSIATPSHRP
jgi:isoquinoline 1-oxidoreductase beta subunit